MLHTTVSAFAGAAAASVTTLWWYGAMSPSSQLFGRHLSAARTPEEVALSYDDGPNGDTTLRLIDILGPTPATFFLIGNYVRQQPQIVRRLAEAGHTVGNHTMSHPVLTWQSSARIRQELAGCNAAIEDATGAPVRYFRPPHGARRPAVMRIAKELGLTAVLWNATAYDWNPISADAVLSNVTRDMHLNQRRGAGTNVLFHDGGQGGLGQRREATLEATEDLIRTWSASGIRFVSLDHWQHPRTASLSLAPATK